MLFRSALDSADTLVTESGKADYSYFAGMMFAISLRDTTNSTWLRQRDIRWFDRYRSTTNGKPSRYATYSLKFYLDPTPDGTYSIQVRFRKQVDIPVLTQDSYVPVIGEEWHEAIELGATYRGARSLGYPDAAKWLQDLKDFMIAHSEQGTEEEEDADIGFAIEL